MPLWDIVTSQDEIKKEAERFSNDFLTFDQMGMQEETVAELQKTIPFWCSDDERAMLTKPVTEEEIREVMDSHW